MLVVWADQVEDITLQVRGFEARLLALVWRSRDAVAAGSTAAAPVALGMPSAKCDGFDPAAASKASAAFVEQAPTYDFESSFPADFVPPARDAEFIPMPDLPPVSPLASGRRMSTVLPFQRSGLDSDTGIFGTRRAAELPPAPITASLPQRRAALLPLVEDDDLVEREKHMFAIGQDDDERETATNSISTNPYRRRSPADSEKVTDVGKASLSPDVQSSHSDIDALSEKGSGGASSVDAESGIQNSRRPLRLLAPSLNGISTGFSLCAFFFRCSPTLLTCASVRDDWHRQAHRGNGA